MFNINLEQIGHMKNSQLICTVYKLTGFYVAGGYQDAF